MSLFHVEMLNRFSLAPLFCTCFWSSFTRVPFCYFELSITKVFRFSRIKNTFCLIQKHEAAALPYRGKVFDVIIFHKSVGYLLSL